MLQDLVKYNNPSLTTQVPEFDFLNTTVDPIQFAKDLSKRMFELGGIGLAANQLGEQIRAFSIQTDPVLVCFNPIIVDYSEEVVTLEEGCLSYPDLVVKVTRPKSIRIRYTLPNGDTQTHNFTGMTARIMQHELDHLNGKRFFDVVDWWEHEKVKKWFKKAKRNERKGK